MLHTTLTSSHATDPQQVQLTWNDSSFVLAVKCGSSVVLDIYILMQELISMAALGCIDVLSDIQTLMQDVFTWTVYGLNHKQCQFQ